MSKDEESFPTVIGRVRDTMPSPPDFMGLDGDKPVRVSANGRAAFELTFPGGEVTPRKPTPAELALSAKQWSTRLREDAIDRSACDSRTLGYFKQLDATLAELAACLK